MVQSGRRPKLSSVGRNRRYGRCITNLYPYIMNFVRSLLYQSWIAFPMDVYCNCVVALLKYYPSSKISFFASSIAIFVIKGRDTPTKHIKGHPFQKVQYEGISVQSGWIDTFYLLCHRYWPIEDYHSLFSFLLEHSRKVILDSAPCAIALRFLS